MELALVGPRNTRRGADEGGDLLAPLAVGNADHRHLRHRRMQEENVFDSFG
jgi:hypothetical protein